MGDGLRKPFQYFGGKGQMTAKLLPLIPTGGRPYCEPFCGGASLFFAREPAPVEVLNDLNGDIVNFFRVLQDKETFEELRHRLMYTPYARAEFARAIDMLKNGETNPVLRAWAFFVRQNQGMGGSLELKEYNWGRTFTSVGGMSQTVNSWIMRLSLRDAFRWRLMHAQIERRDALETIKYWDNDDAVFYIDPPYHLEKRSKDRKSVYGYEMGNSEHEALVETLINVKGAVTLSLYYHDVYSPLERAGWKRIDYKTSAHTAGRVRGSGISGAGSATAKSPRIETVMINPKAIKLLKMEGRHG